MGRIKLSVVLMLFCAVKCYAMSYSELEDFAEYLTKTSQLTPSLKQGAGYFDEYDEDEHVSDNAWEESGKFEGDLILNERQRRLIVQNVAEQGLARNGIIDAAKRWPNNEVIYAIQVEHFTDDQVQAIQDGIDDIARASCIKFRRYRRGDQDAVVIQGNRRGCFSQVGYQGGYQALNLNSRHRVGRGCFRHGTVVHELLHSLGFYHMQSSPDRDDYVDIIWDNIAKPSSHNFRKYNTFTVSDFGVGYDYDSVLHYSRKAFSINGKATIVPKQRGAEIGQRVGMSDKDTEKLNKMYCDSDSDSVQSVEDSKEKSKKKSIKNKPFEGHGLGYHKGTAVLFKLLPEAENYKLADVPSSHVFDYFSKPPQILSTTENEDFRVGMKIKLPNKIPPSIVTEEYEEPVHYDKGLEQLHKKEGNYQIKHPMPEIIDINLSKIDNNDNKADLPSRTFHAPRDEEENPEIIESFDRLSKIIKSHVYPSHTPDLSIYRTNDRYQKLKSNGEVETGNDYPSFEYMRFPVWEGGKEKLIEYHEFMPMLSTSGFYKIKPAENNNRQYPIITIPKYKDKYEKYEDHSHIRYPEKAEYGNLSTITKEEKKTHSSQDASFYPITEQKHIATKYKREGFSDYLQNLPTGEDNHEDVVKTDY